MKKYKLFLDMGIYYVIDNELERAIYNSKHYAKALIFIKNKGIRIDEKRKNNKFNKNVKKDNCNEQWILQSSYEERWR